MNLWCLFAVVPPTARQPMTNQLLFERQTIRLSCNVSGWPTPSVSWTKNGEDVVPSARINVTGHELLIAQAAVSDSGIYQCLAENIAGHVALTARVHVELPGIMTLFVTLRWFLIFLRWIKWQWQWVYYKLIVYWLSNIWRQIKAYKWAVRRKTSVQCAEWWCTCIT